MPSLEAASPLAAVSAIIIGYLSGSIPFGLLLARWAGLGDVRAIGSGNIGATNVLRTGNRLVAAVTLVLDIVKGTAPVLIMTWQASEAAALIGGVSAFVGHLFPVWLGFRGGKGVATYIGVLFGLAWPLALLFLGTWLATAAVFRRSSVSALTAAAIGPFWAWLIGQSSLIIPLLAFAAAIWIMHRANIVRLLKGEEPTIRLGKEA